MSQRAKMADWLPFLSAIIVAILGSGAGYLLLSRQRRKLEAESTDIITGAAVELVKSLKTEVADLRAHVNELDAEIVRLKESNRRLQCELDEQKRTHRLEMDEFRRGAKR